MKRAAHRLSGVMLAALAGWAGAEPAAWLRGVEHERVIRYTGCALRAKAVDPRTAPLMVAVAPGAGADEWRLRIVGFVAGDFDVAEYVECANGARAEGLAAVPVRFVATVAADAGATLGRAALPDVNVRGGPVWLLPGLIAGWALAPAWWLVRRWRGRPRQIVIEPVALPDPLHELTAALEVRELTVTERARLELMVLRAVAQRTRGLEPRAGGARGRRNLYLAARRDPAAAPLLDALEAWLHQPRPTEDARRRVTEALHAAGATLGLGLHGAAGRGVRGAAGGDA